MSHYTTDRLLERAADLIDELASHPSGIDEQIMAAISANDYDELNRIITNYDAVVKHESQP